MRHEYTYNPSQPGTAKTGLPKVDHRLASDGWGMDADTVTRLMQIKQQTITQGGTVATDTKMTNDKGLDSSRETNPQSPQNRAGHAQDFSKFSKGTVNTNFKGVK